MSQVSRRRLVKGLVVGAVVLGFDPTSRSWVTEAEAKKGSALPPLDGTLTTDPTITATYADDFGHIIQRTPMAILFAGSVQDIVKIVKYANQQGLRVGPRGKGHTVFGQSQVEAGILIDMGSLDEIHAVTSAYADVDAGVVWRDLIATALVQGVTPPVLTDYTGLTVGGTLSVGGVGTRSYRHGAQVDNVMELTVVTGEGQLFTCSANHRKKLFDAALAGLGLCGIIVRAKLRMIPAKQIARTHRCFYTDSTALLADLRFLVEEQRFDSLVGNAQPSASGWGWYLEATSFFTPGNESNAGDANALPVPADPFDGLNCIAGTEQVEEKPYFEFTDTVFQLLGFLNSIGLTAVPHPWLDLFVPDSAADDFVADAISDLNTADFLPGSVLILFPFVRENHSRPLFRIPCEETFFLFDILQAAPPVPALVNAALQRNRALWETVRSLGGTQYTISAIAMSPNDWKKHFGSEFCDLADAKQKYDKKNVLGAGPGVFP